MFTKTNSPYNNADDLFAPESGTEPNENPAVPKVEGRGNRPFQRNNQAGNTTAVIPPQPAQGKKAQTPPAVQPSKGLQTVETTEGNRLPPLAVALIPASAGFGFQVFSSIIKVLAGTAAAPAVPVLIYLGSPVVTPFIGLGIIALSHHQGWLRTRTLTICTLLGWSLSLPFAPIFLIPMRGSIPTMESLTTPRSANFKPVNPSQKPF